MPTKKKSSSKKTTASKDDNGQRIAVLCDCCGGAEVFKTLEEATKWIKQDIQNSYGGHDLDSYTIIAGQKVDVSISVDYKGLPEGFAA